MNRCMVFYNVLNKWCECGLGSNEMFERESLEYQTKWQIVIVAPST